MAAGRPPSIRDTYLGDAQTLINLARAVQRDAERPIVWRKDIIERLESLATDLLNAPKKVAARR